jgi:hypothetical protein
LVESRVKPGGNHEDGASMPCSWLPVSKPASGLAADVAPVGLEGLVPEPNEQAVTSSGSAAAVAATGRKRIRVSLEVNLFHLDEVCVDRGIAKHM